MNEGLRDLGCPACKSLQKIKVTSCSKTTVNCLCPHSPLNQSSVSGWKDVYPLIMGDVSLRTSHSDTPGALLWILFTCSLHTITKPYRYFISSCKKHKTVEHKNFLEPRNFNHNHIRFVSPQISCLETWAYPSVLQKDGGLMVIVEQCEECYILHHFQACQASKSNNQTNKT